MFTALFFNSKKLTRLICIDFSKYQEMSSSKFTMSNPEYGRFDWIYDEDVCPDTTIKEDDLGKTDEGISLLSRSLSQTQLESVKKGQIS